jgi:hypothetical protein
VKNESIASKRLSMEGEQSWSPLLEMNTNYYTRQTMMKFGSFPMHPKYKGYPNYKQDAFKLELGILNVWRNK